MAKTTDQHKLKSKGQAPWKGQSVKGKDFKAGSEEKISKSKKGK